MAQIAQMPSGLEAYTRRSDLLSRDVTALQDQYPTTCGQDEFPTALRQDEYPTACNVSPPYYAAIKEAKPTGENGGSLEKSAGELKAKENRICGVSRLTFWLGLVVGVLIVVVAVVGGTLGSRIRKEPGSMRCVLNSPPYCRKNKAFLFFLGGSLTVRLGFHSAIHHQYPFPPHPPHSSPSQPRPRQPPPLPYLPPYPNRSTTAPHTAPHFQWTSLETKPNAIPGQTPHSTSTAKQTTGKATSRPFTPLLYSSA